MARCVVIVTVALVAMVIPNFTDFLNITGAVGGCLVAIIMPPLLYNLEFGADMGDKQYYFNWSIIVFGIIGAAMSLTTSFNSIRQSS